MVPILVTFWGIVIEVSASQFKKALPPILVTLSGILTDMRAGKLVKALSPMPVTPSGNTTDVTPILEARNTPVFVFPPPTLTTGYPSSADGTVTAPVSVVVVQYTLAALPSDSVYSQVPVVPSAWLAAVTAATCVLLKYTSDPADSIRVTIRFMTFLETVFFFIAKPLLTRDYIHG
ncbi:MAG TPA: hypothetical protein VN462_09400 [Negativicutes bacterium]|nr:hypothetical protein [Negativicutes bacterium]